MHEAFNIGAHRRRALVQYRKLRFVIKQTRHGQALFLTPWKPILKKKTAQPAVGSKNDTPLPGAELCLESTSLIFLFKFSPDFFFAMRELIFSLQLNETTCGRRASHKSRMIFHIFFFVITTSESQPATLFVSIYLYIHTHMNFFYYNYYT